MTAPLTLTFVRQTFTHHGGAEKILSRIIGALQQERVTINLIARRWESIEGVHFWRCDPFYLGRWWRDASFAQRCCRIVRRQPAGLVQAHERIACCDIYRAGDGVHHVWLQERWRASRPWQRLLLAFNPYHFYTLRREKKLFHSPQLRAVICNSKMVKQEIAASFGLPEKKLHVIHNGVDLNAFSPTLKSQRAAQLRALGIDENKTVYLFVGSGYERKGLAQLIPVMAGLPETAHLLVIGNDRREKKFRRLAVQHNVQQKVSFLGAQKDVRPYYGAADCFVLPTLYDPFPNAALEAMASGLPVITSTKSGSAELIQNGVHGYVCDALDEIALLQAMRHCLSRDVCATLGRAARRAVEPYTLEAMGAKLLALYKDLLRSNER